MLLRSDRRPPYSTLSLSQTQLRHVAACRAKAKRGLSTLWSGSAPDAKKHPRLPQGADSCLADVPVFPSDRSTPASLQQPPRTNANRGCQGDPILQPGTSDGGTAGGSIATLADYVPLDFGTSSSDCAIAEWPAEGLNYVAGALGSSHELQAVKRTEGVNRREAFWAHAVNVLKPLYARGAGCQGCLTGVSLSSVLFVSSHSATSSSVSAMARVVILPYQLG